MSSMPDLRRRWRFSKADCSRASRPAYGTHPSALRRARRQLRLRSLELNGVKCNYFLNVNVMDLTYPHMISSWRNMGFPAPLTHV